MKTSKNLGTYYLPFTFQRRILAIYTQQKQKEGCEKTQSSFFTSP